MSRNQMLAKDIYDWCKKNKLWGDNTVYFDNKAWSNLPEWGNDKGKQIAEDLYEYENKNVNDYFEYGNPYTVSMSFEGPLYHVLNGYTPGWMKKEDALQKLFEKHGLYFEYGDAWNLSAYEL